ncbi:TlpA family protein disulfide reductase [Formosa sp. S-31]|uniref:TlpA family protein disulfide reductase n=1 Tax=Formosa sp. S-31 TaxID=2790949 RepID=UPI003EB9AA52
MKKIIKSAIIMALLLSMSYLQGQTKENQSRLQGIEVPATSGTTVNFTYTPEGGPLEGFPEIEAVAYIFKDYKWNLVDVKLDKQNSFWKGEYAIPEACSFVAFKFLSYGENGLVSDTNFDNGYIYVPLNAEKAKNPGNNLAWGTFRNSKFNMDFGGYFKEFTIMDEASEYWIKKEIEDHADKLPLFISTYIKLAQIRKPDNYMPLGNRLLTMFLKDYNNLSEEQYIEVKNLFQFTLNNKPVADSLQDVILNKYPNGITKRFVEFEMLRQFSTPEDKILASETFLEQYPNNDGLAKTKNIYNRLYQELFGLYFSQQQYDKIAAIIPDMNFNTINDCYHHNVLKAFRLKTADNKDLLELSEIMINEIVKKPNDLSYLQGLYWSPNQATRNAISQLDGKLDFHIRILYAEKAYEKVLNAFELYSKDAQYSNSTMNEFHMLTLEALDKPTLEVLEKSAAKNALTPLMLERLHEQFKQANHEETFETYLENLKKTKVANLQEEVKSHLTNIDAPELIFENKRGKKVNIVGKKDEIIIIDFWATWCGPCKKAFPGMEMAVNKYKKDENVNFYFVSTQETSENYIKEAEAYIKQKGYDFNVLYDIFSEDIGTNNKTFKHFAKLFKSSGIPRKVVIKNGKLRYTSEGYSGSPSQLADELSAVMELLKSEDN